MSPRSDFDRLPPLTPQSVSPAADGRLKTQSSTKSTGPKLIGSQRLVQSTQPCPHTHTHVRQAHTSQTERSLLCRSIGHIHTVRSPSEATHTIHAPSDHQDTAHDHESSPSGSYIPMGSDPPRSAHLSEPAHAHKHKRAFSRYQAWFLVSVVMDTSRCS